MFTETGVEMDGDLKRHSASIKRDEQKSSLADDTLGESKAESTNKDHAVTPKVNPFRPDLPFSNKKQNQETPVNRTTEW